MNRLQKLQKRSGNAINSVMNLIETLKETNKCIDTEKSANSETIKTIQQTQQELDSLKVSNEKIISNFEGLLK